MSNKQLKLIIYYYFIIIIYLIKLKLEVYRIYPTMYVSMGQGERLNWISGVAGNSSKRLFSTL